MNKLVAKHLQGINAQLTGVNKTPEEGQSQVLNEVAAAPYEQNESFYYIYRSLSAKAAKLGCEIIKRKPFKQKNDLTALVSALTMLKINGVKLTDYQNDIGKLLDCFAADDLSGAEKWMDSHKSTDRK